MPKKIQPAAPEVSPPELLTQAHIIVNPSARRGQPSKILRQIAIERERWNTQWTVRVSMNPGQAESLAVEAAQNGANLILAAGGDGTLHEVVNGYVISWGHQDAFRRSAVIARQTLPLRVYWGHAMG